ncbi:hypothetical protein MA16_Dca000645 [Dendrobium catenatum]|uniref:Uncharacterized protein n=1 Tax=Dendrobium catenatum TaxID=906689 RepID=A0A2I0WUF9_9ASPA|nr:hypothetical protein MA16_Dca000645 [Dendrobium catenatum]
MAEDILQNIEDGELWLPSDVIRAVGVCRHHHLSGSLAAMDDLAQKLACLDLLDRRRVIPSVKPFKDSTFNPEVQLQRQGRPFSPLPLANGGYKAPVRRRVAADEWTGAYFPVSKPVHKFYPALPVDSNIERIRLATARVLQRQRQQHGHLVNRFIPTRSACSGRETGGTGVFLPRAYRVDSKKKPYYLFPANVQGTSEFQQPMWSPASGNQSAKLLSSSEIDLPHDWTY